MIIGHYDREIWAQGGRATYIRRVSLAQKNLGHKVYFFSQRSSEGDELPEVPIITATEAELFSVAQDLGVDILNVHQPLRSCLDCKMPIIRTLHQHTPYCPSGSKFLARQALPCNRSYSIHGCLWGHFIDRCGSVRPQKMVRGFQRTLREFEILANIPVVSVSHYMTQRMLLEGYSQETIFTVPHFAPDDVFSTEPPPKTGTPHFVFLGRLTPKKGLRWLLHSVKEVTVPIHLDIAGEGDEALALKSLSSELSLNRKVTFHGWLNSQEIEMLLSSARALVFPSLWHEPAGLVALEAMKNARAVIGSSTGGIPEMVFHKVNGLLVQPGNIDELAEKITQLSNNWVMAKELGENGKKLAMEEFSLQKHLEYLMAVYQKTIDNWSSFFA